MLIDLEETAWDETQRFARQGPAASDAYQSFSELASGLSDVVGALPEDEADEAELPAR